VITARRLFGSVAKIVLIVVTLGVVAVVIAVVAVHVSPKPFASYVRNRFSTGVGVTAVTPAIYRERSPRVRAEKDIEYPSRFGANRLDVFSPADASGPLPTILWVHGGGFVGGDKAGIETWATIVAAEGYTVVSMNYAVAPESHYPTPVLQVEEAHAFLKQNPQRFPAVDLRRLILGGDSAGAQIAAQFTALQTNPELARSMRRAAVVAQKDLVGVILYCGPYDLRGLYDAERWFPRFFVRQIGWAYFDSRDWRDSPQALHASVVEHVTPAYPPAFITDGNTGSFEADARKLEARLRERGVAVESLYFPAAHGTLPHEYQFDFSIPESMQCLERTLAFLEQVVGGG